MKIGVVGCGALGSYYGACLGRAGHETHFLLRSDFAVVREQGVTIETATGNFVARPRAAKHPDEIGVCDLVLIGLKTTANDRFADLLPPLVGPRTMLLTLQNGLGNEAALARLFPVEQILGGLCFVCLNRLRPGLVRHLGHGFVVLGEYLRPPQERTHALAAEFERAGVRCSVSENLEQAHWEKLVWNIPFNGLGVAGMVGWEAFHAGAVPPNWTRHTCLPTDELLADPRWESVVRGLMREVVAVAAALGYAIAHDTPDKMVERTRVMGAYRASTLVDFERGQPLELESLFFAPREAARNAGVATPLLDRLCAVLAELDARRTKPA
ncbi:MAG: 2-dehydropantoate 2-reductase [Limisphaerales bacterium]